MNLSSPPDVSAGSPEEPQQFVLRGTGVAPGIVIGRALVFEHEEFPIFKVPLLRQEVKLELARVEEAKRRTLEQLQEVKVRTVDALGEDHGYIFDAQMLMLDDPLLIGRVREIVREQRVNAEWAVNLTAQELASVLDGIQDEHLRERRGDLFDVTGRLNRNIAGVPHRTLGELEREHILLSENVRPSDTAQLDWEHTVGLVMEVGGRTYHTAIIARSLGIPCVVGVKELLARVDPGAPLVIDGSAGLVIVHPDRATLRDYRNKKRRLQTRDRRLEHLRELPPETRDGHRIVLQANVEFPEESHTALSHGTQGIGLFRSEWFLTRHPGKFPTEEEQYAVYRAMAEQMKPWSVIVRAFDLSAEQLGEPSSESNLNPALGLRAIRLLLERKDLFKEQLRALLRARRHGNIKVMFPMISGVGELREALAMVEAAKAELLDEGKRFEEELPCGVTLEVPSATATADLLAREADFFSIGTNDLIQYMLGVDRGNEQVSYLYEPLHPAVLRAIRFAIDSGHEGGIKVGMCGEMAADPLLVPLWIGLGIDELSMNPASIPAVKNIIRNLSAEDAKRLATEVLSLPTVKEVSVFLREELKANSSLP